MRQEVELVPYAPSRLSGSPLLVLAPHPDDEIFGGGALLVEAVRSGAEIHIAIVTDGVAQGDPMTRRRESLEAARRLKTPGPEFWSLADRSLEPDDPELIARIGAVLERVRPEILAIPSPAELHPDHRALALAVYRVLQQPGRLESLPPAFQLAAYEISAFIRPNVLVDVTADWPDIRFASEAFGSQNEIQPYLEVLDAVATARRLTLPAEIEKAAAFYVVDAPFIRLHTADMWAAQQGPTRDPLGPASLSTSPDLPVPEPEGPAPDTDPGPGPRVSVVIRTKDRPERLEEALTSLARQNHRPIEAIVVNDGGCPVDAVLGRFRGDLDPVAIDLDASQGRSAAANRGIERASGPWLTFLDDDDLLMPGALAALVAAAPSEHHVVYGRVIAVTVDPDSGRQRAFQSFGGPFDLDALLFENTIPIIGCLLPCRAVQNAGGIDEDLDCFEDWDLFLRLSRDHAFQFVDAEVALYRVFGSAFITGAGGQEQQHRGRTAIYEKHWPLLTPERLSRMQFHAKSTLIPEAIGRETDHWRRRVEDLERSRQNLEEAVADWRRQVEAAEVVRTQCEDRSRAAEAAAASDPVRNTLVSIVIVNFNGRHHLELCLPALARTETVPFETIVVDNGSSDGSVEWLAQHHPTVRVVDAGANLGFGEGNRRGVAEARGHYIAFLNNDTVVEPGWLAELIRVLCLDPNIAAACSTLMLLDHPEILNGRGGSMSKLGYGFDRHYGCLAEQDRDTERMTDVLFPTAAAMAMRAPDFTDSGGFDRAMFMYHEDVDFGWRLRLLGRRVVVCRDSVVFHRFGGTSHSAKGLVWRERMGSRHNVRSILKHYEFINILKAFKGLAKLWVRMGAWRHIGHVVAWNLVKFPNTLAHRIRLQRRRAVTDAELFRRHLISGAPYPAPNPEIRTLPEDTGNLIPTPVLRPGSHSAIGRLGAGWFPAHPIGPDVVRPFCGLARCRLKVRPGATGSVEIALHVPTKAVRGGTVTATANGVVKAAPLTGALWQTIGLDLVEADEDGCLDITIEAPAYRPHQVFGNWDFRRLAGAVRSVRFVPDSPAEVRPPDGISVLITTFRRWPVLEMTLEALRAQADARHQVIVMDDGSEDETWDNLQAYRDRHRDTFRLTIATQPNQGQGQARNNALSLVEEDLVLFLGDDIIPDEGFLQAHLEFHRNLGEPAAVVGFTDWYRQGMRITPFMEMVNVEGHQFGYNHMVPGTEQPFTCFYTSNISIPKAILGDHPFDPTFSSYGWEDVELGYRLNLNGIRIMYEEKARAGHFHLTTVRSFFRRQMQVGRTYQNLLDLHPELLHHPNMPPERPSRRTRFMGPFAGPLVALVDRIDRWGVPLPTVLLHDLMMLGFYQGRASFCDDERSGSAAPVIP